MVRKASLLIAEAFDERDIKYTIREIGEETSVVDAGFSITCGPNAHVLFASSDEENDVAVRITGPTREARGCTGSLQRGQ